MAMAKSGNNTKVTVSNNGGNDFSAFLEAAFERRLKRSPMEQTSLLGRKDDQDKWDDLSDEAQDEALADTKKTLADLRQRFVPASLSPHERLSYKLFEIEAERAIEADAFRHHDYPINQMFGWQSAIPAFLINNHGIDAQEDAEAYISRLEGIRQLVSQIITGLEIRAREGILAPKFVYDHVIRDCRNLLTGAPFFASGPDSALLADFRAKVNELAIAAPRKDRLLRHAADALQHFVGPAYQDLIAAAIRLEGLASTDDGVWKLPDGDAYYALMLKHRTTTDLSAEAIHQFGLEEVERIHAEMRDIMRQVGFTGTLEAFFEFTNTNPQFTFPNTPEGRDAYLREAEQAIAQMQARLPDAFKTLPQAELIVKPVEAFRERSAGIAFYQAPPPNGSRPGIYYVNLFDMSILKNFQLEALAYHEGVPGHHMQLAISVELTGLPTFRKFGSYTAFSEGWGLYAEFLAKEMGFYPEPMSDFGRLVLELWRATRLVVDTGLHAKRWTREETIAYLQRTTPNTDAEIVTAAERYIVLPGQATAYKVGRRRIVELREQAKARLGDAFDLGQFHDVVLTNGPVPMGVLEELVGAWAGVSVMA